MFFGMIFLCIFVHRVWSRPSLGFVPHLLQLIFVSMAVFVSLSRVIDNKHHPTDVLAGSVLGIIIALVTGHYLNAFFRRFNSNSAYNLIASKEIGRVATDDTATAAVNQRTTDSAESDLELANTVSGNIGGKNSSVRAF